MSVERPAFVPTSEESKPAIKIEVIPSTESAELPEPPAEPEAQLNLPPVAHGPAEYDYWIEDGQDYCAQW
ncbi:MAG TPA: hypothetical protein VFX45_06920 [Solirubrobacterales bacterium]|nr:hypothetical protein [Solirubrobacterales bacterium]